MIKPNLAILDRHVQVADTLQPIHIGVVSFLPPQTALWDAYFLTGQVEIDDILASAKNHVSHLQQAGCDLIIALAHSGLGRSRPYPGQENAVIPLAALDGIDVVIAGHTHLHLPGSAGSHLGVIDLDLQRSPKGR